MAKQPQYGAQRSKIVGIGAPSGGWNARDALTAMAPTDAITLENFIPDTNSIHTRHGYSVHSTGVGTRVDSLMQYSSPTADKLFAASSGGKIMEVTSTSTATSTALNGGSPFTNGQFQHTMMGTPAGSFLWICNGADVPYMYDGSTWATASVTGCTAGSSAFINVAVHQSRLWLVQKDTLDAWYMPTASVQGAASRLQLGPFCKKGGYLQAIATWTRDGGTGLDDQIVFLTSKGEAILYSGTDPSDSTLFAKVGTFNIPEPVGRRCWVQIGADIALISSQGVVPLSAVLPLSPGGSAKVAATEKISAAFQNAYSVGSTNFGWQALENSRERLLVINVPLVQHSSIQQFVMNTNTGAWCKFTGISANCWATLGDQLYFGGTNGTVYRYGGSSLDGGTTPISAKVAMAFNNLKSPSTKQFLMARPTIVAPEGLVPALGIHLDYDTSNITPVGSSYTISGPDWDITDWDSADWAGGTVLSRQWQTINGIGSSVSPEIQVDSSDTVTLNAIDIMYEPGGDL